MLVSGEIGVHCIDDTGSWVWDTVDGFGGRTSYKPVWDGVTLSIVAGESSLLPDSGVSPLRV